MPPKMPSRRPLSRPKSDPTVNIAQAATAKMAMNTAVEEEGEKEKQSSSNDDLKKLIETLKSKLGSTTTAQQKQAPPAPKAKWNRSISNKKEDWTPKPAYTLLSRLSNHEMIPQKANKQQDLTTNAVPHSFLYRPGADGIKVGILDIKAGKQLGTG